ARLFAFSSARRAGAMDARRSASERRIGFTGESRKYKVGSRKYKSRKRRTEAVGQQAVAGGVNSKQYHRVGIRTASKYRRIRAGRAGHTAAGCVRLFRRRCVG